MSIAEESWSEFLTTLSEKEDADALKYLPCPLEKLLDEQKHADDCRKNIKRANKQMFPRDLKNEFNCIMRLYLQSVDLKRLSKTIEDKKDLLIKNLGGLDRFNHLKLLVRLKTIEDSKPKRRGLLAV